jgi:hypothetical protein
MSEIDSASAQIPSTLLWDESEDFTQKKSAVIGCSQSASQGEAGGLDGLGGLSGFISMTTLQSRGGDFLPLAICADTPMRCFPIANSIRGLVAVIPFINPCAFAGAGIENSRYGFSPEISYTSKVLTHAGVTFAAHAGVFVKS